MSDYKVTLWPSGEILEISGDDNLLTQLKKAGKKIKSSCGGCATCTDCTIIVKSGEMNLTPQTFEEVRLLGNVFHITKERLACQTKITGEVTLDISAHEKNASNGKNEKASSVSSSKSTTTKLKKRKEIEKVAIESKEKTQEKSSDTWYRHWENDGKDDADNKPRKLGGNKRVKPFNFNGPE